MNAVQSRKSAISRRLWFFDHLVRDPELGGKAVNVAWRLIDRVNDETGLCCPSVETLTRELGVSESTVQRAIGQLVERGWFTREHKGRSGTRYYPNYERVADMTGKEDAENPADLTEKGCTSDQESPADVTPEPINEPISKPSASAAGAPPQALPPANAAWKAHYDELVAAFGEADFKAWLAPATPLADDGKTLTLAVPTRFLVDQLAQRKTRIEQVINRTVIIVQRCMDVAASLQLKRTTESVRP